MGQVRVAYSQGVWDKHLGQEVHAFYQDESHTRTQRQTSVYICMVCIKSFKATVLKYKLKRAERKGGSYSSWATKQGGKNTLGTWNEGFESQKKKRQARWYSAYYLNTLFFNSVPESVRLLNGWSLLSCVQLPTFEHEGIYFFPHDCLACRKETNITAMRRKWRKSIQYPKHKLTTRTIKGSIRKEF